uniref:TOM1-like protein 2 n=1 Tax=Cacopsylla melanoneura TaxID=428564 RepID=A0A8D9BS35_9HEMI
MASFFGATFNPFGTPVGSKIDMATDPTLASENWALNMEICDIINETEDGPKDAVKAIRKKLQQYAGKDYTVIMYTLTVLETCVKNCNKRFHVLVCSKDFIQELYKLIGPKNEPPIIVQEKVLSLIQSWADAFKDIPNLEGVNQVYQELRTKGIEFPMTDLDAMAPIITPKKSKDAPDSHVHHQQSKAPPAMATGDHSDRLTPEQITKLNKDLEVVHANMAVLNEMLTTLIPGQEHSSDIELLTELHRTCKAMQERVVQLISKYSQEDFVTELLQVNDLMNNLFLRYNRYESNSAATGNSNQESKLSNTKPDVAADSGPSLIDLDDEPPLDIGLSPNMSKLNISKPPTKTSSPAAPQLDDSEFDMFAQSRNVTYEGSKKSGSSYEDNLKPAQMSGLGEFNKARSTPPPPSLTADPILGTHKESDFDEMAAWLGEGASGNNSSRGEESLTSSEFERFLAERAVASDSSSSQPESGQTRTKQEAPVFGVELSRQ